MDQCKWTSRRFCSQNVMPDVAWNTPNNHCMPTMEMNAQVINQAVRTDSKHCKASWKSPSECFTPQRRRHERFECCCHAFKHVGCTNARHPHGLATRSAGSRQMTQSSVTVICMYPVRTPWQASAADAFLFAPEKQYAVPWVWSM